MTTAARHMPFPPDPTTIAQSRTRSRWPLLVIGAAAGTATWSGWVGLGQLTGFGVVHPLPGIWDAATLNTAITLPVGVEAYAIYALAVATDTRHLTTQARRFGWISAFVALGLGMAGQVAFHLLAADHAQQAPGTIVAAVSCLPVLVLGAASLLWHLAAQHPSAPAVEGPPAAHTQPPASRMHPPSPEPLDGPDAVSGHSLPTEPGALDGTASDRQARPNALTASESSAVPRELPAAPLARRASPEQQAPAIGNGNRTDAEILADLHAQASREIPSMRSLMRAYSIGQTRATRIRTQAIQDSRDIQQSSVNEIIGKPDQNLRTDISEEPPENDDQEIATEPEQKTDTCITDRVGQPRSQVILVEGRPRPVLGHVEEA